MTESIANISHTKPSATLSPPAQQAPAQPASQPASPINEPACELANTSQPPASQPAQPAGELLANAGQQASQPIRANQQASQTQPAELFAVLLKNLHGGNPNLQSTPPTTKSNENMFSNCEKPQTSKLYAKLDRVKGHSTSSESLILCAYILDVLTARGWPAWSIISVTVLYWNQCYIS